MTRCGGQWAAQLPEIAIVLETGSECNGICRGIDGLDPELRGTTIEGLERSVKIRPEVDVGTVFVDNDHPPELAVVGSFYGQWHLVMVARTNAG